MPVGDAYPPSSPRSATGLGHLPCAGNPPHEIFADNKMKNNNKTTIYKTQ